jgi:hypothetical protein
MQGGSKSVRCRMCRRYLTITGPHLLNSWKTFYEMIEYNCPQHPRLDDIMQYRSESGPCDRAPD